MTKKSMLEILNDDEKLAEYITSLEEDVDNSYKTEEKLDEILSNIMSLCDNFKDRRALRSQLIESVTNLIKLKMIEAPKTRIENKKKILDIMTKKQELELKNKQIDASNKIAENSANVLRQLFNRLDQSQIYPHVLSDDIIEIECKDILDTPDILDASNILEAPELEESATISKNKKKKKKLMTLVDIQSQFDQ